MSQMYYEKYLRQFENLDYEKKVTKYMSFERFTSLLVTSNFWFSSPLSFDDKEEHEFFVDDLTFQPIITADDKIFRGFPGDMNEQIHFLNNKLKNVFIHSWTEANFNEENYALWKVFVPHGIGVKVTLTIGQIMNSIQNKYKPFIQARNVTYDNSVNSAGLIKYLKKAKAYEYEKEIRLVLEYMGEVNSETLLKMNPLDARDTLSSALAEGKEKFCKSTGLNPNNVEEANGISVPVDLNTLLGPSAIVTPSPFKGGWSYELIQRLKEKFDLNFKLVPSSLSVKS